MGLELQQKGYLPSLAAVEAGTVIVSLLSTKATLSETVISSLQLLPFIVVVVGYASTASVVALLGGCFRIPRHG